MFKLTPIAVRADRVYDVIPWQEVIHLTAENAVLDGRHIHIRGKKAIHFGNCSYVGLDVDQRLKTAAIKAIERYGVQFSSSRSYVQMPMYEELEALLSQMFGGRPIVVTPSTSLAHQSAMPIFIQANDAVLVDYQAHASMQVALEIVRAKNSKIEYLPHNDLRKVEERLEALSAEHERVWYVADGIYSMFGDTAPFSAISDLLQRFDNLHVYLDDAHGMSWSGDNGTGFALSQMPLHERLFLVTSLNKGFAAGGGAIVCPNQDVKKWLRRTGGNLIFSGPVQPSALAAGIESASIHLSTEIIARQNKVMSNVRHFLDMAQQNQIVLADQHETPIFYINVGKMEAGAKLCSKLREAGFYTNLGIYPAVPMNQTGLRISLNYHLEKEDIEGMLSTVAEMMFESEKASRYVAESVAANSGAKRERSSFLTKSEELSRGG